MISIHNYTPRFLEERNDKSLNSNNLNLTLYTDGASRGNPGPSGIGIEVVNTDTGITVLTHCDYIGIQTNNYSEYFALITGLKLLLAKNFSPIIDQLDIKLDSNLVVQQVLGNFKVKNSSIQQLHQEVMSLLEKFKKFSINHLARGKNTRADRLANLGIDNHLK